MPVYYYDDNIENMEEFHDRLRIARRGSDNSQKNVCESLDINKGYYSSVEGGKENPTLNYLLKVIEYMGCELVIQKKKK